MAYQKAPITEAVIELRFAQPVDIAAVENAARRARDDYLFQDAENAVNFKLDVNTRKAEVETAWHGVKLSSMDRADSIFFRTNTFICSRLAPYLGWENFCARAKRGWEQWRRTADPTELARIGVRYVNRIDIPLANPAALIDVDSYLNVTPRSPEELSPMPMSGFTMQIVRPLGVDDCTLVLNSATVPSPLIGFASLALDLDIIRETNIPRRDEDLWGLVNRIRDYKNQVFESCITDQARALFDRDQP
jgi:uncharacterized protein (TIGR04255 family)